MAKNQPPTELSIEEELAAAKEALRLQELDAAEREERISTLEAQQVQAAKASPTAGNLPQIEHDGTHYKFVYPALKIDGVKMTAVEMSEDEEVVARLIDNGSAALVKV
jgi:hypothetical protein